MRDVPEVTVNLTSGKGEEVPQRLLHLLHSPALDLEEVRTFYEEFIILQEGIHFLYLNVFTTCMLKFLKCLAIVWFHIYHHSQLETTRGSGIEQEPL